MQSLYIKWSSSYETGIPILDEQHRGLVTLINTFFFHKGDAEAGGDISTVLVPVAQVFRSYVRLNFLTVEKLLRESHFPGLEEYIAFHRRILRKLGRVDRKYRAARDADGMLLFLKTFWLEYVRKTDHSYLDYLRGRPAGQGAPLSGQSTSGQE